MTQGYMWKIPLGEKDMREAKNSWSSLPNSREALLVLESSWFEFLNPGIESSEINLQRIWSLSPTHLIAFKGLQGVEIWYQPWERISKLIDPCISSNIKSLMKMKYKLLKSKLSLELQIINLAASLFHCFPFGTTMLVFRCCMNVSLHWIF